MDKYYIAAMEIKQSELIINKDGSIYHLNLLPGDIATTIITVGDPGRVDLIKKYMSVVHISKKKREFYTVTGEIEGKPITVISTGIGSDNIDIVLNELDALINIDFNTRIVKDEIQSFNIYRIGTSGGLQEDIPVDSILISEYGIALEGLMSFYDCSSIPELESLNSMVRNKLITSIPTIHPLSFSCSEYLLDLFPTSFERGMTLTMGGFYAPQGRQLRAKVLDATILDKLREVNWDGSRLTNFEMETGAIYGMAQLMGHRALSLNVILANRGKGTFSPDPKAAVINLIDKALPYIINEI